MTVPLRRVLDSLADGVVVVDPAGRCLLFNPAARRLLGADPAGVRADDWASTFGCLLPDMVTPCPPQEMPLTRTLRGEVVRNLELFVLNQGAPQGAWLSFNNRVLHADTEAHRFATLLLAVLHVPSRTLAHSSAGHTPGYLLDGRGAVRRELFATGLPLGLFPDSVYETRTALRVEPGDTLVLLTDGVTDSGTPEEELFGAGRALDVVRSSLGARSSEIVDRLYRAVRGFENGGPQRDDVTVVVARSLPGS